MVVCFVDIGEIVDHHKLDIFVLSIPTLTITPPFQFKYC